MLDFGGVNIGKLHTSSPSFYPAWLTHLKGPCPWRTLLENKTHLWTWRKQTMRTETLFGELQHRFTAVLNTLHFEKNIFRLTFPWPPCTKHCFTMPPKVRGNTLSLMLLAQSLYHIHWGGHKGSQSSCTVKHASKTNKHQLSKWERFKNCWSSGWTQAQSNQCFTCVCLGINKTLRGHEWSFQKLPHNLLAIAHNFNASCDEGKIDKKEQKSGASFPWQRDTMTPALPPHANPCRRVLKPALDTISGSGIFFLTNS